MSLLEYVLMEKLLEDCELTVGVMAIETLFPEFEVDGRLDELLDMLKLVVDVRLPNELLPNVTVDKLLLETLFDEDRREVMVDENETNGGRVDEELDNWPAEELLAVVEVNVDVRLLKILLPDVAEDWLLLMLLEGEVID